MKSISLLQQDIWREIDESTMTFDFDTLKSFATDDTLCLSVGKGESPPVIRSWVHYNTVVLGIQDSRLPFIEKGISFLESNGYQTIVRNSGGLAVVLDHGILNISLILPDYKKINIDRGYEAMFQLIKKAFSSYNITIEAKEIHGSYCPGSYDLSINDRKFAGISQRRVQNSMAVQIYLCVKDSGAKRAHLIKDFYNLSIGNEVPKFKYPTIKPDTMASLSELLNEELEVSDVYGLIKNALRSFTNDVKPRSLSIHEKQEFETFFTRVKDRNEKALPNHIVE